MKYHKKIWLDLCHYLANQTLDDLTKYVFFKLLCEWLIKNMKSFGEELWKLYRFEAYVNYEPSDYPMECSDDSVKQTIDRITKLEPSSMNAIAMIIRDILWDLVAYKSDIECSNCGDDDFRVLYDEKLKQLVLSCDLCGWSQYYDGRKWLGDYFLVPAKFAELKANGYIK